MKITGLQVFWMITIMDLGMTLIMTLSPSMQSAKQDVWISMLFAGCLILLVTFFVTNVTVLYPEKDLIQLSHTILGKWIGKVVVLIYLVQWYTITPIVLRQFVDVIQIMILPETPKAAVMLIMLLLIVYTTHSGGIVSIARCSEILGPIIILMVLLAMAASFNNIDLKYLLPVYADSGIGGIAKGTLAPASYLGHSVEYLMLASFLYQPRKGAPYAYWGVITAAFFALIAMLMATITLGVNILPKMWYPFFEMSRKISLFGFIENFDPLSIVIWVASVFIKLAIYLFISSYGTAQFLKIKNWKVMIWLIAPVIMVFAYFPTNVSEATSNYLMNYWVPFALPVNMIALPLLLLIVGKIKQKKSKSVSH
ncbi:spore germination protein KB [Paenibacillus algorifonticola]|uniref:Spore germination protein KB n=1 Tax=Paenibacillus algorifonticola TaxID=684063 RepID=A0A1I2IQ44_9BACL|nr:endospore germination permease [Paenibacillus algorifonticola]SFF42651.1 spore germination protein KB [Paenibacillus algorifonticola]